ncbi:hypothetical protein J8629_15335 [Serratia fonticola]|uniref:hypothetical protein n=1 Tax=Serratia fonticola TaxID=47917 RepID=UPI001AEB15C1|nr:hypothetical protein [Serratia fonticola]MBP0998424.1 hypothetical protein [Serratia fonticola]
MTTVTTEAIAGVADLKAGYTLGHADVAILKTISAELLAVREAQSVPVASTTKSNIDAVLGGVSTVIWPVRCFKGETHVNLYTAPPAPAVQLCFHDAIDDMENVMAWIMKLPVPTDGATAKAGRLKNSIAACRAAMLQPVSQGYRFDGLNIRAVAALRSACSDQWLKSEVFADKVHWQNMHSIANEIMEAMAAAPTPTK